MDYNSIEKYTFGGRVTTSFAGNLDLPTPLPTTLLEAETLNTNLFNAWNAYEAGGVGTKALWEAAVIAWDAGFSNLADYTDSVAQGNVVIIASGGWYNTDVAPTKRPAAGAIAGLAATHNAQAGSIKITTQPADFADSYITIISSIVDIQAQIQIIGEQFIIPVLTAPVIIRPSQKVSVDITNLVSGTRYYIYRFARNTTGRGPDSQTINIIAP